MQAMASFGGERRHDHLARAISRTISRRAQDLGRTTSKNYWAATASFREVWMAPQGVFQKSGRDEDDEDELIWAAMERLPTFKRMRKGILTQVLDELIWAAMERLPTFKRMRKGILTQVLDDGKVSHEEVDVTKLGSQDKKQLMESILKVVENDNERFLRRLRNRTDRVGIEIPTIEIRFEQLSIEADAYIASRALPTLLNSTLNALEAFLEFFRLSRPKKRIRKILRNLNGVVKPSRMTLLLGPPGSGKTTFLLALAGKLDKELRVKGKVTYCGHEFKEFIPQRTCAYISQHDLHFGELTVRETLDFSGRCLAVGTRYDLLMELSRREKEAGIKPDPEIDAFMKATAMAGQETNLITDYVLKILGLDVCADTIVGDDMKRGISGGQKKRVTTGEMLVGPAKALFMDEISTGLDSSTTFQIVKFMRQMVHIMDVTMVISLLQPAPETFELFDNIILISEGHIVYQGPRENILEFFERVGFKCPERKGVADFLQEVTSRKDQEQYWCNKSQIYRYISAAEFGKFFKSFHIGENISEELRVPYDKSRAHPAALVKEKYGLTKKELFKACFSRELMLIKRNSFMYIFKTVQITFTAIIVLSVFFRTEMKVGDIDGGQKYMGALFFTLVNMMFNGMSELVMTVFRLPVFYKQRDFLFYPAWAFGLPICLTRIPISLMESGIWVTLTYYAIGFAPSPSRFLRQLLALFSVHQMALSLFRFLAAVGRIVVVATTLGTFILLLIFVLGGFIISKDDLETWMLWAFYLSPMMYGQNAIAINEFLDKRWSSPIGDNRTHQLTVGKTVLKSRGMFVEEYWYWISIAALWGFSVFFNATFIMALAYLNPLGNSKSVIVEDNGEKTPSDGDYSSRMSEIPSASTVRMYKGVQMTAMKSPGTPDLSVSRVNVGEQLQGGGMVLPFQPLSLTFNHVNYYVDMPPEMKFQGVEEDRLQLLQDVSGAFRPGILTALVGVSGAGKTTLMDVLAGRKTGGYIEGTINISGYPKNQETFARVSGYCEQNDIHSPRVTVYESLVYSAWLRLGPEVNKDTRKMFVEEVMDLVELTPLRNALVGLPGLDGLSTEQRKRLTIAVELVANPSIIFMDEPTSGLDARAAAIVMRTVRNTVDTGRTVVCTIHQPSIDIFESFDELLLMKRGGQVIYAGPLGRRSRKLTKYFEAIQGVPEIRVGYNPATWMLEVTGAPIEAQLDVDFAEIYANSDLYQRNQELIKKLSIPAPGVQDLYFPSKYAQNFITQCMACFWKQHWSYWRNPRYNVNRFCMTIAIGTLFGLIFWNKGSKLSKQQDLFNLLGAMYTAVVFLGSTTAAGIIGVVSVERTVFYREKAAGMYSALPYAFSQVAIESLYVMIQTVVYSSLVYFMIGFKATVVKFLLFYIFMFMSFTSFALYGMMVVALTPGPQIAGILMSFFLTFWNLFSGFLIPRTQLPLWWRWYYWLSPIAWTLNGLVTSQLGDVTDLVDIPGQEFKPSVKVFLKQFLGFDQDFLGFIFMAHIAFICVFCFVFAYSIKFLNFQRR